MTRMRNGMSDHPLKYKNSTGASMPAFGIFKLEGGTRQTSGELNPHAELSTATGTEALYVNSALAIADNGYGNCRSCNDGPFWVAYNPGNAPDNGDVVGPVSGETYVDATGSGLVVIFKDAAKGIVLCEKTGGGAIDVTGEANGCWTIVEYEPTTGAVVQVFDRGRSRLGTAFADNTLDIELLLSDDEQYLYSIGQLPWEIRTEHAYVQKWNIDTGELVWSSDDQGNSAPLAVIVAGAFPRLTGCLLVNDDGKLWATSGAQTAAVSHHVAIYDPDTGVQQAVIAISSAAGNTQLLPCPTAGSMILIHTGAVSTKFAHIYDSSLAETHSSTGSIVAAEEFGGRLYVIDGTGANLSILDASDLTVIDTRAAPAGHTYRCCISDGNEVWVSSTHATTPKYFSYDASNLATENWNTARDTANNSTKHLRYVNGALYDWTDGKTRKINASNGAEIWESGATLSGGVSRGRVGGAAGSNFTISTIAGNSGLVACFNDSDGSDRWRDSFPGAESVVITSTDRVFVCGVRKGPL